MVANEPCARLIKEASLMQERGVVGGWGDAQTAYAGPQPKQKK